MVATHAAALFAPSPAHSPPAAETRHRVGQHAGQAKLGPLQGNDRGGIGQGESIGPRQTVQHLVEVIDHIHAPSRSGGCDISPLLRAHK